MEITTGITEDMDMVAFEQGGAISAEGASPEPILIVSRAELKARLVIIQGEGKNSQGLRILRDPVLDKPSFDNNFGVSNDPLATYRTIDHDGIAHIIPAEDRRFR